MAMYNYRISYFFMSAPTIHDLPDGKLGMEVAFIGYSNSGKSSVINALTGVKKLTKVSCIPGSTKYINLFEIEPGIRLVDFPGYGYSKKIKTKKEHWYNIVCQYLKTRKNLKGLILIMDIRHVIKCLDYKIIEYVIVLNIKILILLNKSDKISKNSQQAILQLMRKKINKKFSISPQYVQLKIFSSTKKYGVESVRKILNFWLNYNKLSLNF